MCIFGPIFLLINYKTDTHTKQKIYDIVILGLEYEIKQNI